MEQPPVKNETRPRTLRFGAFEVDPHTQELRKQGARLRLPAQSVQILLMLLESPGELVSREELRKKLWPEDTFVDFDHGVNAAVNRLREALGDSAEKPKFVETLPQRGYRFIAAVEGLPAVEGTEEVPSVAPTAADAAADTPSAGQPAQTGSSAVIAAAKQHKLGVAAGVFAALIVLGAAGFGVYSLWHRPARKPFENFTITQVTNTGKAARAAISPDGRYVLSVMDDNGLESLWLRNVPTGSDTQVIPPSTSYYGRIAFSPDGNYIYFCKSPDRFLGSYDLYRSPILGGTPHLVVHDLLSNVTFSPDAQRIAYIRWDSPEVGKHSFLTASLEGNDEKVLKIGTRTEEEPGGIEWSPSGDKIFYSLRLAKEGIAAIDFLDVNTSRSQRFDTFKREHPMEIRWSPDGRTLFVNYWQRGTNATWGQIGYVRSTGGNIEPITRDTNRYTTLTLSADGRTLATVLARSYATVSVLSKSGREFGEPRLLFSQSNEYDDASTLTWAADGTLLLSSVGRLSKLGADGKNQTQLLADSNAIIITPSVCGTNYLVLTWALHGGTTMGIWRTDADGSSPLQLTNGKYDLWPVCSPDHKWVYYVDFVGHQISRVPLDGSGKAEAIFANPGAYIQGLGISPDGKTLAAEIAMEPKFAIQIALLEVGSSSPPRMLDASRYESGMQFTPDGKSVAYVGQENGVGNVWVQPLDGSAGHPIRDFKSEQVWAFSLSPDGKSLAVLRGHWDSDVVLLQESK